MKKFLIPSKDTYLDHVRAFICYTWRINPAMLLLFGLWISPLVGLATWYFDRIPVTKG